jgi:hypothetical protein
VGAGEEYRHFAAECLQLAEQIRDPDRKLALLAMAVAWQKLAEFIESPAIVALGNIPTDDDQN